MSNRNFSNKNDQKNNLDDKKYDHTLMPIPVQNDSFKPKSKRKSKKIKTQDKKIPNIESNVEKSENINTKEIAIQKTPQTKSRNKKKQVFVHILSIGNANSYNSSDVKKKLKEFVASAQPKHKGLRNSSTSKRHVTVLRKKIQKFLSENKEPQKYLNSFYSINPIPIEVVEKIHSKNFREYCNHTLSKELDILIVNILNKLAFYQKRSYDTSKESNGKFKKRFVFGFHEVSSRLSIRNQVKFIIISTNIQNIDAINQQVLSTIISAREQEIPIAFSLNRFKLGFAVCVRSNVSVVAILDCNNVFEFTKEIPPLIEKLHQDYLYKITQYTISINDIQSKTENLRIG